MALARLFSSFWRRRGDGDGDEPGEQLVHRLKLPLETSRFVVGLGIHGDPSSAVYVLGSYDLSTRAVEDAERLIQAAKPASVVVQARQNDVLLRDRMIRELDEGRAFVPDSPFDFVKQCLVNELTVEDFHGVAAMVAVRIFFGTLASPMVAAKHAAAACGSEFNYLEIKQGPELSLSSFEAALKWSSSRGEPLSFKGLTRVLNHRNIPERSHENSSEDLLIPEFASSNSLWDTFISLDEVNRKIPGIDSTDACSAVRTLHKVLQQVGNGGEVSLDELSLVCRYRLTVEYSRLVLEELNSRTVKETPAAVAFDFNTLSEQDKGNFLLARALHKEAIKSKTVVAIVNPDTMPGLQKYWKAVQSSSSTELDELVNWYLVRAEAGCDNTSTGTEDDNLNSKLLFELGGCTAALLGASKLVTAKRGALKLASQVLLPGVKFPSMAKLSSFYWQLKPTSTAASVALGKIKARSLSVIEKGFYGVMRYRNGLSTSRWPWLLFGGSVLAAAPLFWYEHRLQLTLESLPSARPVARLGQGIKNLKTTAEKLKEIEDSQFWRDVYSILYRSYKSTS